MPYPALPRSLVDRLDLLSRPATCAVLAGAGICLVAVDHAYPQVGMGPAYVPLVALAAWRLGPLGACAVVLAASVLNVSLRAAPEEILAAGAVITRAMLRVGTYAFVAATTCALRGAYDRERTAARRDFLTGAFNRAAFEERAARSLAAGPGRGALAVALIDVDRFKRINDAHGHAAGDDVLRTLVRAASPVLRGDDVLARLGGDEFAASLSAATGGEARARVAALHRALSNGLAGAEAAATASLGACIVAPGMAADLASVMREADRQMYAAKAAGSGDLRAVSFTPARTGDRILSSDVPEGRGNAPAAA